MSDDEDMDFSSANRSGRNLASLFQTGDSAASAPPVASTQYVAPKQPKKESPPRVMIASAVQAYSLGTDQKWATRGKLGVALLSTENTIFQLILYVNKTQTVTSLRLTNSTVFTPQANNYLAFQDDANLSWSIMFETKQAMIDFTLQILVAKAFLSGFKFDHFVQEIREGEGAAVADQGSVEVTMNAYKVSDNGTLTAVPDTNDNKPIRVTIGKQQYGKTFDDILKGMKKGGHRLAMISTALYSLEVVRIKRDKEPRTSSIVLPAEELPGPPPLVPVERKATITEDPEGNEKNRMLQRINRMGGISMLPQQNNPSAFAAPMPPNMNVLNDDDSIMNEYAISHGAVRSTISTPAPPVQFVHPTYHHPHPHYPPVQSMVQQLPNVYSPVQPALSTPMPDYHNRAGSSMAPTGYAPAPTWQPSPYPQQAPADLYYQQQPSLGEFRQLLTRLTEKVDSLNEKVDEKSNKNHPNMETSILLANIQRIVKENETMKKDLFDRSAKVEEQNSKISELLDRNQKLIEQSHQTAEQRNVVVNNVSEQTAQKILELEKQKVELTNSLSVSMSKIGELQLQVNQLTEEANESQSRLTKLTGKCEQSREERDKAESQRAELQAKVEAIEEQLKTEKLSKKQLQSNCTALAEELNEVKVTLSTIEKTNNERKLKQENERRRWENELEEQKQSYEKELDELRNKLRKQRTADSTLSHQEIDRIEQEWKEKLDRLQSQHERLLASKSKEVEQLRTLTNENEAKFEETVEELNQSKEKIEAYEEQMEKAAERIQLMREKIREMEEEQTELTHGEVKRTINMIFQKLKKRIHPERQLIGEEYLSRTLNIMKKVTLKVISDADEDEEEQSSSDEEEETPSEPTNGNSIDQQALTEAVATTSTDDEEKRSNSNSTPKSGWDTVDDLPEQIQQSQIVVVQEEKLTTPPVTQQDDLPAVEQRHDSNASNETVEENQEIPSEQVELPKDEAQQQQQQSEEDPSNVEIKQTPVSVPSSEDENELFESARPSIQDLPPSAVIIPPRQSLKENIPLMSNDDSDDELFK